ncbi:hypothetical protein Tco_0858092 [Tanacetum coccineum]|uniref:SWIM-type domain-containing protein n=1 Tax=Tanacetum coccineum TaxID=301880 RepID=A0ABQ5B8B7_9ASTR
MKRFCLLKARILRVRVGYGVVRMGAERRNEFRLCAQSNCVFCEAVMSRDVDSGVTRCACRVMGGVRGVVARLLSLDALFRIIPVCGGTNSVVMCDLHRENKAERRVCVCSAAIEACCSRAEGRGSNSSFDGVCSHIVECYLVLRRETLSGSIIRRHRVVERNVWIAIPQGTGSGSGPRRQDTILGDIPAQTRVLVLENVKIAQDLEITSLKKRVKKLEKKKKARTPQLKWRLFKVRIDSSADKSLSDPEDASKQGRNEDQDEDIFLVSEDAEDKRTHGTVRY